MSGSEREFADAIYSDFITRGVIINNGAEVTRIVDKDGHATIMVTVSGKQQDIDADTILVATGRKANIDTLNVAAAGVKTDREGIVVDDHLHTSTDHIWAIGDVRGGEQFANVTRDDSQIVLNELYGDGNRTLAEQRLVPHVLFVKPAYAAIGLNEDNAKEQGISYRVARFRAEESLKAHILGNSRGIYKALVDDNDYIIGASLYALGAYEVINILSMAIHNHIKYQQVRDQVYAHPTMSESLNNLFGSLVSEK
jgi:pyruvate/2-oxoglutarate dehydrogenase complex dihydrolipoamide dehydrogenase (E3) component